MIKMEKIFTGEIDSESVDSESVQKPLIKGISQGDILDPQIRTVGKILGLNLPIVTVIYARIGVVSRIISIRIFRCPIVKLVFVYRSKLQDVRKIYGVVEPKVSFSDTSQEQGKIKVPVRCRT